MGEDSDWKGTTHKGNEAKLIGKIAVLEIEIADKQETIKSLTQTVSEMKVNETALNEEAMRKAKKWLEEAKGEFEHRLSKQIRLIDNLTNDKLELTRQLEICADELMRIKTKAQTESENISEELVRQVEKAKRQFIATEKVKREQWEREKEEEINQRTAKALEPQIDSIIREQRDQRRQLEKRFYEEKASYEIACEEDRREALRRLRDELKDHYEKELESTRNYFESRLRELFEEYQKEISEERVKNAKLLASEREKATAEMLVLSKETNARVEAARELERVACESEIRSLRNTIRQLEQQLDCDSKERLQRESAERELWKKEQSELLRIKEIEKEKELRRQLQKEQDEELEILVNKLSSELEERLENAERQSEKEKALLLARQKNDHTLLNSTVRTLSAEIQDMKDALERIKKENQELKEEIKELETLLQATKEKEHYQALNLSSLECELSQKREEYQKEVVSIKEEQKKTIENSLQEYRDILSNQKKELAILSEEMERKAKDWEREREDIWTENKKQIREREERLEGERNEKTVLESKVIYLKELLSRQRVELLRQIKPNASVQNRSDDQEVFMN